MRGDWLLTEQAVAPTEKASVDQCAVPAVHARSAQSVKRGNAERIAAVKPTRICGIYKKKEGTNRNGQDVILFMNAMYLYLLMFVAFVQ